MDDHKYIDNLMDEGYTEEEIEEIKELTRAIAKIFISNSIKAGLENSTLNKE